MREVESHDFGALSPHTRAPLVDRLAAGRRLGARGGGWVRLKQRERGEPRSSKSEPSGAGEHAECSRHPLDRLLDVVIVDVEMRHGAEDARMGGG